MKLLTLFILIPCFGLAAPSQEEIDKLKVGELIYHSQDIKDAPWPQVTIFARMEGISPKESAAIFSSYEDQKTFVPDMLEAKVVKVVSPTDIHVRFVMDNPWPITNEHYTTGNILSRLPQGYRVSWYLVESESLHDTRGQVSFLEHSKGTILSYQTFVHPKSSLAFLAAGFLKGKISNSLKSIASYLPKLKKDNPDKLKEYLAHLEKVLGNRDTDRLQQISINSTLQ